MHFSLPSTVHWKNTGPCSLIHIFIVCVFAVFAGAAPLQSFRIAHIQARAAPGCHISAEVNKQALASVTHTLMRALPRVAQSMLTQP